MSLFKRKETTFEDMDSQEKLKKIMDQLGFLEKKLDSVLEALGNRGGRPSFGQGGNRGFGRDNRGGNDRGGFRGGNRDRGGFNRDRNSGSNTRYGGQGPQRYNPKSQYGGGNDDNRGNFGGERGGQNRHEGRPRHQQGGPRRDRHQHQGGNPNVNPNGASSQHEASAADEAQPE